MLLVLSCMYLQVVHILVCLVDDLLLQQLQTHSTAQHSTAQHSTV
jgi:hypothetical protein